MDQRQHVTTFSQIIVNCIECTKIHNKFGCFIDEFFLCYWGNPLNFIWFQIRVLSDHRSKIFRRKFKIWRLCKWSNGFKVFFTYLVASLTDCFNCFNEIYFSACCCYHVITYSAYSSDLQAIFDWLSTFHVRQQQVVPSQLSIHAWEGPNHPKLWFVRFCLEPKSKIKTTPKVKVPSPFFLTYSNDIFGNSNTF